ncbi:MAG: murein biosynthesis integral membrane protein MurJ [Actinomycetota bacterium]
MSGPRGSTLVAAGILLSRIAGLVRTVVLAVVLGGGAVTDAFSFAMRVPNLLQNLLGEGSLSASFIPVYARLVEEDRRREADALAGAVVALLAAITAVIVLAGVLAARPLVWLFTSWESDPAKYELAITLTRITTIGIGFLVISAWCLGILNSHRSFFLSYVAPVVWNLTQVVVLVVAASLALALDDVALALAWAVVVGSLLQLLVQLPRVRSLAPDVRPNLAITDAVRDVLGRFGPAVGARGVVQISSYADLALAGLLVTGALSWYTFALPLYLLPISLFGFSVAAAELAEMSRRSGDVAAVAERLQPALRRVVVPAGFVTAAYVAAAPTFVDGLYGWLSRQFDRGLDQPTEVLTVALLLAALGLGLPAAMTARVTQNTLYSLGDVRGPARIAIVRLVVSVTIGLVLIVQLDWLTFDRSTIDPADGPTAAITSIEAFGDLPRLPPWDRVPAERRDTDLDAPGMAPHLGAVGLALAASVAAWTEWLLLRRRLRTRFGITFRSGWGRQVTAAGAAAGAVMAASAVALDRVAVPGPIDAVAVGVLGLVVYVAGLWIQGIRSTGRPTEGLPFSA